MRNKDWLCSLIILITAGFLFLTGTMSVQAQEQGFSREEVLRRSTEHFQQGEEFYSRGDFLRADEEFKRAQELLDSLQKEEQAGVQPEITDSDEATALNKAAEPAADKIESSRQEEADYAGYLTQALESSGFGDSQKAISSYLRALERYPDNPDLHYNLGIEYLKTRKFDAAVGEFNKVVQLNPEDKDAYYNLGVLHENYLRNLKLARFYYSRYVKLGSREADVKEVKSWIRQIDKKLKQEEKGL